MTEIPRTSEPVDSALLERTMQLAELGRASTRPNPVVGAVLATPSGDVIASGHHARRGELHAERAALADLNGNRAYEDATLYVSLEPCAHQGSQPPCVDAIIEAQVRRVVYAAPDANPATAGHGPQLLRDAGIEVARGSEPIEQLAVQQNAGFFSSHLRGRPWVAYKWAMTSNGRLATGDTERRWISDAINRAHVHYLRAGSGAILVGVGTVLADDPQLTVRGPLAKRMVEAPIRVVVDRDLRTPIDCALVRTAHLVPVLVIGDAESTPERDARDRALFDLGVEVMRYPRATMLRDLLSELHVRGVQDVLCEAGPTLATALFEAHLIDQLHCVTAPFEAPDDQPGFAADHPLRAALADTPAVASGADQVQARVLHPLTPLLERMVVG